MGILADMLRYPHLLLYKYRLAQQLFHRVHAELSATGTTYGEAIGPFAGTDGVASTGLRCHPGSAPRKPKR